MKRHEGIAALSRDHHFGLLFCWKIREGIKREIPVERMLPYVQYFWENHLEQHFQEEEKLVFAAVHTSLCDRAILEHLQLRHLIEAMDEAAQVPYTELGALADRLDQHIRFEERVLFPHIEKALPEEVLQEIGLQLSLMHEGQPGDSYVDAFWK